MSNFDQKKLVCTLSLEPDDGFWPNFMSPTEGDGDIFGVDSVGVSINVSISVGATLSYLHDIS